MCDQQNFRSACAYAQSDQSICLSLEYSMTVKLLTEHHLQFIDLKGGCTGSSESTLVKMSNCWKSHVTAHLILYSLFNQCLSLPHLNLNSSIAWIEIGHGIIRQHYFSCGSFPPFLKINIMQRSNLELYGTANVF